MTQLTDEEIIEDTWKHIKEWGEEHYNQVTNLDKEKFTEAIKKALALSRNHSQQVNPIKSGEKNSAENPADTTSPDCVALGKVNTSGEVPFHDTLDEIEKELKEKIIVLQDLQIHKFNSYDREIEIKVLQEITRIFDRHKGEKK